MRDLGNDLKIAARRLRHSPGFALTAVVTLTMAITANLVVFGVLNAAVLRPLNVPHPERLVMLVHKEHGYTNHSYPDYADLASRNKTLSAMAAYRITELGVSTHGAAQRSWSYEVSGNYFDMLGVHAELGRVLHASDEHGPNSAPYVVLSDAFWRSRFGADPGVIGTTVDLNKHPFTIIGVAAPEFHGTELFLWPDLFMPIVNEEQVDGYNFLDKRYNHSLFVVGALQPGLTRQQATDDLNRVAAQMQKVNPVLDDGFGIRLVDPGMFGDELGPAARQFLAGLLFLALLVLAAACVNLASIFAARAADRERELAVRIAIGSSRWRVLRQVLAEAVVLSAIGGVAGAVVAGWLLRILSVWHPIPQYPIHVTVVADARVYGLAVLLAAASGVLPALLTARQIWKTDAMQAMKGTSQPVIRRLSVRDVLLGVQVALCALLVTCALVGVRGMQRSLNASLGFQPRDVTLASMQMKMAGYTDKSAFPVQKHMIEQAQQIPGVTAVGTIDEVPLNAGGSSTPVFRAGTTDFRGSNSVAVAKYYNISPGYLTAAQTRLLAGRDFTWSDDENHPKVAIINQRLAHLLFGNAPAVGRHFTMPGPTDHEVIGVVEDGKYDSMTEEPKPAMFWPLGQYPENDVTLVVRSNRTATEMAGALSTMLTGIDPTLPVNVESWPHALDLALFPSRVATVA
ncbi:MAG TPA: ABC transporter permease, partial [Acidobacteriaceae bacterium]|nr:ABC transporter permease [Acidobacteriaceae bacterium]